METMLDNLAIKGVPAASGIAIGRPWVYQPHAGRVERRSISDVTAELARLAVAKQTAKVQLAELQQKTLAEIGEQEAAIFEAHQMFLEDPELDKAIHQRIEGQQICAEAAVE